MKHDWVETAAGVSSWPKGSHFSSILKMVIKIQIIEQKWRKSFELDDFCIIIIAFYLSIIKKKLLRYLQVNQKVYIAFK